MKHLKSSLIALALAAVATATLATPVSTPSGSSVTVKFDDPIFTGSGYDGVTVTYALPGGGLRTSTTAAGRFQGTASNLVNVDPRIFVDGVNDMFMYCYDIYQSIRADQTVTYTIDFNGATARTLDFLGAVNSVMSAGMASVDPFAWLHPVNGNQGAAIQLGIWESLYDSTGWNLGAGSFQVVGGLNGASGSGANAKLGTATYFNSFVSQIDNAASLDVKYTMTLKNADWQDMIAGDPPVNVPEPGSLALVGLALAGLAGSRKLRRKA